MKKKPSRVKNISSKKEKNTEIKQSKKINQPLQADVLYGKHTALAIENFPISDLKFQPVFIHYLALIKSCAAKINAELNLLTSKKALAIQKAANSIVNGHHYLQFPLDVFQTGSGTSVNMNANEVIAQLANSASGLAIHPNDDVNKCQSSNDVIPSVIHISAAVTLKKKLLPALQNLAQSLEKKAREYKNIVKTGRTHLMDAMPITLGQEFGCFARQIRENINRIKETLPRLNNLALGGTAVGTGVNAHPQFAKRVCALLARKTGIDFKPSPNFFEVMSSQDTIVELSGHLKVLAVSLYKMMNDLRLMNSGPIAGLNEIILPTLQPGSSIMPGKVNPVIPEAVAMVCAQVIGNDTTITLGGLSGNFQLNTMLPVIAYNILQSIQILSNAITLLNKKAILGLTIRKKKIEEKLSLNPILVTALNPIIGYEKAAEIAKRAYKEERPIVDVAAEMTTLSKANLKKILDPKHLV